MNIACFISKCCDGTFYFIDDFQASLKDAGNYTLIVSSSVFHERSVTFRIVVERNEVGSPATSSPNTECLPYVALMVPMIILIVIIIILAIVIIALCKQKNNAAGKIKEKEIV